MWTNKYIGIPYKANGRDINGADCWGLTRLVYSEQFNIELPSFSSEYDISDDERILELIAQYREGWEQQDTPVEGSLVLFRILGVDVHIGIAISATQFLHIREGGDSAIESFDSVKWARRINGYFKYSPKNTGITLNAVPHPLRTERITKVIAPGTTLYEVYTSLNTECNISPELKKHVNIIVNGRVVPEILWDTTILKSSDTIEYRAVPGKDAMRMVLMIIVVVIAYNTGVYLAGAPEVAATAGTAATYTATQQFVIAATAAAVNVAGMALINAIAPIRPPDALSSPASSTAMLMVNGANNSFTPYAAIPVILGKVRVTPPLGASTYVSYGASSTTETVTSSDSYLNLLLAWGYGPLHIDLNTLRIGTTSITNYNNVNHATISYETTPTTAELTTFNSLYSQDVQQNYKGVNLTFPGRTLVPTTTPTSYWTLAEIQADVSGYTVFAPDLDSPDYTKIGTPKLTLVDAPLQWVSQAFPVQLHPTTGAIVPIDKVTIAIQYPEGLRTIYMTGDRAGKTLSADGTLEYQLRYYVGGIWGEWGVTVSIGQTDNIPFSDTFGAPNSVPVNDGFTTVTNIRLPRNDLPFELRVRRIAQDAGDYPTGSTTPEYHSYSTTTLTAFTTYRNIDNVISDPLNSKIAKTAIHIKATDQLSGQIDGISAIVQTITPVWNGSAWVSGATSNPAALFRYILQHPGNPQRILDADLSSKVNLTQLQYWSEYCATKGFEFNTVLATQRSVSEVLRDICAAGRASPAYVDGKWTVVIDEVKSNTIQHFSTHNSWGFEGSKLLPKYPDGLKIQFYDEENDYQQAETIVYVANKNASNAELFESIQLPGVTKTSSVIDHARWHFAQIKLRPEIYTLNTDIEYLVCNRGDRVKVTHDVPMWGAGSGRIKNRVTASVFDTDEEVPVQASTRYTIRVRSATGTSTECELKKQFTVQTYSVIDNKVTIVISNSTNKHPIKVGNIILISTSVAGINTTATITDITDTSISYALTYANVSSTVLTGSVNLTDGYYSTVQVLADVTLANATAGDLFLFGQYQTESQDLIVLSIEPMSGASKTAKLTMVDYGVSTGLNIFTDYATVTNATVFNSNMTNPPLLLIDSIGAAVPTITTAAIRSDESVMELISPGVFRYKLKVPYTNPEDIPAIVDSVEAQLCLVTDANNIGGVNVTTLVNSGVVTFTDVQLGYLYKVRLRYIGKDGRTGLWTSWVYPSGIVGKSTPPSDVAAFAAAITEGGITLKWTHCPEIDYASTIIKAGLVIDDVIPFYSEATTVFEGAVDNWTYVRPVGATYKFWAIHKDTSGNLSTTPTLLTVNYTSLVLASINSELSNPTPFVPSDITGSNPVLTLTGTTIKVYEGGTLLKYDAIGTANSRWKITSIVNSTGIVAAGIPATATAIDYATMPILSSFANTTSGTVTYTIDGKTSLGTAFTLTNIQYFTKIKPGATGANGVNAVSIGYTNDSLTVPVSSAGVATWAGSGGLLQIYDGGTALNLITNAQTASAPASGTTGYNLNITAITGDTLTEPAITGVSTNTATVAAWAGTLTTATVYRITAYIRRSDNTTLIILKDVSISPSKAGIDSTVYYLALTAPVITKEAPDAATLGTHSSISIQGKKSAGTAISNYGWVTYTANGGTEVAIATDTAATPVTLAPGTTDAKTSYTIKMYNQATVSGATLLDTQIINIVFKGTKGTDGVNAVSIGYTNDSLTVPVSSAGVATWAGSGGLLQVYDGGTALNLITNAQTANAPASGTTGYNLNIAAVTGDTLTEPDITGVGTDTATVAMWAGTLTTATVYRITAYIRRSDNTTLTLSKDVSISPSNAGIDSTVYYLALSSPVITKESSSVTTNGVHSSISIQGKKSTGDIITNYGWITYTANGDTEAVTAANTAATPVLLAPIDAADKSSYTIKMYSQEAVNPTKLLDTQVINIVFKGNTGTSGINAPSINYTNDNLTVPVSSAGTATWTASGGLLQVYDGATALILRSTASNETAAPISTSIGYNLAITKVSGDTLTIPTITNTIATSPILDVWAGTLTTATVYRITAYIRRTATTTVTISKDISIIPGIPGIDSTVYYLALTAPVITKEAPDAATSGTHSSISIQGKKSAGDTTTNYGWVTYTANGGTESTPVNTEGVGGVAVPYSLAPGTTDAKTSYTIKMYSDDTKVSLLDTQVINVLFKGNTGNIGNYVDYMFQRSDTALTTAPTGNTPASPWLDAPADGNAQLWVTSAEKTSAGVLVGSWSVPAKLGGESVKVEYSINGTTLWHATFATGDIYMRQTVGTGTASGAIRIVGEKGETGANGNYVDYMFQRSDTALTTAPTGNTPASPWLDAPADGTAQLWVTSAEKTSAGVLVGSWSVPAKLGGESVKVEYSINGTTLWHATFATGDIYMRQTVGTGTASGAIRIVGEKGDSGNYIDYMFQRSDTALTTAPTGNTPASPWLDAPTNGTAQLWVTTAEKTSAGVLVGSWSVPAKLGGESVKVEYSINGTTLWHATFATGDIYMRQTVGTGTASGAIRIVGETGTSGAQTFRAYIKTAGASTSPSPATPAASIDGAAPTGWSLTPITGMTGVEAQWQTDGKIAAGATAGAAGNTTWSLAYLSYFKVGSLSAISADLGSITAGSIKIGTSPVISTSAFTSGSGAVVNTNGSFGFGNATTSIVGSGTGTITLTGNVVGNGNINDSAINARTIETGAVTASKIDITNSSTAARIVINSNQFIVYDSTGAIRVKIGNLA